MSSDRAWTPRKLVDRERLAETEAVYGPVRFAPRGGYKWGGHVFATNGQSRYGVRYQCLWCNRIVRGTYGWNSRRNHWPSCPVQAAQHLTAEEG